MEDVLRMFGPVDQEEAGYQDTARGPSHVPTPSSAPTPNGALDQVNVNCHTEHPTHTDHCDLGVTHKQCVAARSVSSKVEVISLVTESFGVSALAEPVMLGTLNKAGDYEVGKTFHGARAKKGGEMINQSVTLSLDPRNLTCLSCEKEHPLLQNNGKPIVMIFSDQNYIPMWSGSETESCVTVVRVMNPSLMELVDLLAEIIDRRHLPDGSVLLLGSVTFLQRVGVSVYAREWTKVVGRLGTESLWE